MIEMHLRDFSFIAEARMRNKAMKREALQAAREAKKERGELPLVNATQGSILVINHSQAVTNKV